MNLTSLDFLFETTPPWIYVGEGEPERVKWIPSYFYSRPGLKVCTRKLRGWKMHSTQDLMNEAGAALQLFDGFGENWHALEECLCYMDEWLPADAYVIVVEGVQEMLPGDLESLKSMLITFNLAGNFWSRGVDSPERFRRDPAPFHLLLNVAEGHKSVIDLILNSAAESGVAIRTDPPQP